MKFMSGFAISTLIVILSAISSAHALDLEFRCTLRTYADCEQLVDKMLSDNACVPMSGFTRCTQLIGEGASADIYCDARAEKCGNVSSDGFLGADCAANGQKIRISERHLTATWSKGWFQSWVRDFCKYE